jgi:hypothetical protein
VVQLSLNEDISIKASLNLMKKKMGSSNGLIEARTILQSLVMQFEKTIKDYNQGFAHRG